MSFFYLLSLFSCSEKTSGDTADAGDTGDSGESTEVTESVQIPSLSLCSETRLETQPGEIVCTGQSILEGAAYAVAETRDSDGLTVAWPTRIINTDEQLAIVTPLLFSMYGAYQGSITYRIFDKDKNELESIQGTISILDSDENGASELQAFQDAFRQFTDSENVQDELNVQQTLLNLDVYLETYNRDVPLVLVNGEARNVPVDIAVQTSDALRRFRNEMDRAGLPSSFDSMTLDQFVLAGMVMPGLATETRSEFAGTQFVIFAIVATVAWWAVERSWDIAAGEARETWTQQICDDEPWLRLTNSCLALNEEEPLSDPLSDVFDVDTETPLPSYDSSTMYYQTGLDHPSLANWECSGPYAGPAEGQSTMPEGVELNGFFSGECTGNLAGDISQQSFAIDIDGQKVYTYSTNNSEWIELEGWFVSESQKRAYDDGYWYTILTWQ